MAACLVGLGRFLLLGHWSLWLDEAFTLADARHARGSPLNPFGYMVFGLWFALGGDRPDELWMRLPAAVFGWLSIPASYAILRWFVGARAGACAAFLIAASPWHLYWSQNSRFYTLALLLALVGCGFLVRGLLRSSSAYAAVGVTSLALAALAHPSVALLAAPLLIVPWIARWFDLLPEEAEAGVAWRILSGAGFLGVLAGMGWLIEVWANWERRQGQGDPKHFVVSAGYFFGPTVLLAYMAGLRACLRDRKALVPAVSSALALAGAFLASCFVRVSAQYVFVLLPWVASVAAVGIQRLARDAKEALPRRTLAILAIAAAPGLVESALYFAVRHGDRPRWREAMRYVFDHRSPGDLVLSMEAPVAEYYLDPTADDLRNVQSVTWLDDWRARLVGDWARYERPTWFVINREQLEDWDATNREEMQRVLARDCTLEASFEIPLTPRDLDVFVYRRE